MKESIRKLYSKHEILCKAMVLNILFFIGMHLMFKPTWHVDNAIISTMIYGGMGDDYGIHPVYTSFPYAYIVVFFLRLFPGLPWFTILDRVWLFVAFTLVTYLIYEKYNNRFGTIVNVIMLTFFTYEGYACQQFTKTSVFLVAAGVFGLVCSKKRIQIIVLGLELIVIGYLLRATALDMVMGGWIVLLAIGVLVALFLKDKAYLKKTLLSLGVMVGIFALYLLLSRVVALTSTVSEEWIDYNEWTSYRSLILDYAMPEYEDYAEEYAKMGVSESDLEVWYGWNRDPQVMTTEVMESIVSLREQEEGSFFTKVFDISNIYNFFKKFPLVFLEIDTFYAFLFLIFLFVLGTKNDYYNWFGIISTFAIYLLLNYYLFINGRYLKHRVDVGISFIICLLLIYWMKEDVEPNLSKVKIQLIGLSICVLLCVPYRNYGEDKYSISDTRLEQNNRFYAEVNSDQEHYYTIVSTRKEAYGIWGSFGAWDCVPIGFFKNVYGVVDPTPEVRRVLDSYGIESPFLDAVDNDEIYLVFDKDSTMQDALEKYIEEHTGKEVELVLVKEYFSQLVYRVRSLPLKELYSYGNVTEEANEIVGGYDVQIKDDEILVFDGNLHVVQKNGFAQNTYLKIKDVQTEEYELYYVKQEVDEEYSKQDEQYFSGLSAKIELPEFYDENDNISLIIEYKGDVYLKNLSIGE